MRRLYPHLLTFLFCTPASPALFNFGTPSASRNNPCTFTLKNKPLPDQNKPKQRFGVHGILPTITDHYRVAESIHPCPCSTIVFHARNNSKQLKTTQNKAKQGNYRGAGSLAKRARRENAAAFCKQAFSNGARVPAFRFGS